MDMLSSCHVPLPSSVVNEVSIWADEYGEEYVDEYAENTGM